MIAAILNQQPDMVPVAPDISNMVPCRLTGKPFWDIYRSNDPPLWRAYIDAVRHFGMDGWHYYGSVNMHTKGDERTWEEREVSRDAERFVIETITHTPAGDLTSETTYYIADPPTPTKNMIKDLREDFPKLKYMFPEITGYDPAPLREQAEYAGEDAAVGACVGVPGIHELHGWFEGGAIGAIYAMNDYPDEFEEIVAMSAASHVRHAEMLIDAKPDFLLLGASGMWTLSSPEIFRKFSLPTIQKITKMCREGGVPSMLHCCGKERALVEILATETDLDCVNPLEIAPMGDCDLAEIKQAFGSKIALMGNLHTTNVMLYGSEEDVRTAATAAIDAAGKGGGFILSTGDQCGRDNSPDANIRAMVEVARTLSASIEECPLAAYSNRCAVSLALRMFRSPQRFVLKRLMLHGSSSNEILCSPIPSFSHQLYGSVR